jgi:UDP-N-acetylglucosamine--N-acetylmuramyl-(pentapeptide) pyrophosphoryl-undecaprenol N-acetylglucosamine transferase
MSARPVLILAGGTGGHIFPGLAVAEALRARAVEVAWLGSVGGLESRLVPEAGIAFHGIPVSGLRGKGALAWLTAPWRLLRALVAAQVRVRALRPRAAVSFGGFAAGPGGLAARLAGVPLVVHEQNRVPGLTNRVLARLARRVVVGFADAFGAGARVAHLGNPVRASIAALPPPEVRLRSRDGANPVRLLVLGGSQGARALNRAMPAALALLAREPGATPPSVRHQAGRALLDEARAAYAEAGVAAEVTPFIGDMAEAYGWADLVVCRAGALTLAELCAAGVASILVPFPHAVDDHQTRNAEALVERGAALLLPESPRLAEALANALSRLVRDPSLRLDMARAARHLALPAAADRIAEAVLAEAAA